MLKLPAAVVVERGSPAQGTPGNLIPILDQLAVGYRLPLRRSGVDAEVAPEERKLHACAVSVRRE